jgi:hypothetical protein
MSAVGVGNRFTIKGEYTFFDALISASRWTLVLRTGGILTGYTTADDLRVKVDILRLPVFENDLCREVLEKAQEDSEVQALLRELVDVCGAQRALSIRLKSVVCIDRSTLRSDGTRGGFVCETRPGRPDGAMIAICRKPDGSCPPLAEVIEILRHELRHAIQYCQDGANCKQWNSDRTCAESVRREIEAYCEPSDLRTTCCKAFGYPATSDEVRCLSAAVLCDAVKFSSGRHCGGSTQAAYDECMKRLACNPPSTNYAVPIVIGRRCAGVRP